MATGGVGASGEGDTAAVVVGALVNVVAASGAVVTVARTASTTSVASGGVGAGAEASQPPLLVAYSSMSLQPVALSPVVAGVDGRASTTGVATTGVGARVRALQPPLLVAHSSTASLVAVVTQQLGTYRTAWHGRTPSNA